MDDKIYEKYMLSGKIASEARDYGKNLIKPNVSLLEVANKVEQRIKNRGAEIAFPVNISRNELAAHFSPKHDEKLVFKKGDVVKLDVGAHVDGYIADTAVTVEVGTNKHKDLIKASADALKVAIDTMRAGADLSDIGKKIQDTIEKYGYKPIRNLTGHSLEQYKLHAGMSIPNVEEKFNRLKPKVDDVVAIEPFATNGGGRVIQGPGSNIYICNPGFRSKLIRDRKLKIFYSKLVKEFKNLPFAQRWAYDLLDKDNIILKKLMFYGLIKHYPQLIDEKNGIVTQKEHTVIITNDGCEVTT